MFPSMFLSLEEWIPGASMQTLGLGFKGGVRVELGGVRVVVAKI